jgi:protein-tyrosine phosphatase
MIESPGVRHVAVRANGRTVASGGASGSVTVRGLPAADRHRAEADAAYLAAMPADQAAVYKPILDVRPEYLNSGFDEVRKRYGSFAAYEKRALGLGGQGIKDLRDQLLVG